MKTRTLLFLSLLSHDALQAEIRTATGVKSMLPGLEVTEYARHISQANDQENFHLSMEQLSKPLGETFVTETLAPWKWNGERNAVARGFLNIEKDGDYAFTTSSFYDRNLLRINGKVVCPPGDGDNTVATISLKAGLVKIESAGFVGGRGESGVTVRWQPPGQAELSPIPQKLLVHADEGKSKAKVQIEHKVVTKKKSTLTPTAKPAAKPATPKAMLSPKRWQVQVLSATYGTGGKDADVTQRVKELVEVKRAFFAVNPPTLGTDPNPYWNKSLHIIYMKDGVRREQWRNENEHVLPESFYGPQDAAELVHWLPASRWRSQKGELQFHASHLVTGPGVVGSPLWEALESNKIRITWSTELKVEYVFDHTWSSFQEVGNGANVHHVMH
jgi:hypothetical protein